MPKFFVPVDKINGNVINIIGEDAKHITKVLRSEIGDVFTVCSSGVDYECRLVSLSPVSLEIISKAPCAAEPSVKVSVFMGIPKGDKLAEVIKKSVELGAHEIIPVETERSIVSAKDISKKIERLAAISEAAAKQSGRGIIPEIGKPMKFEQAIAKMAKYQASAILYEAAEESGVENLLKNNPEEIAFLVGPEGGFSISEVAKAEASGLIKIGLGKRILRCETAPICFLGILMYKTGNLG